MPVIIFLFAGFSSVVCQSLFIREMLVVFQGNELSIGIILSNWLLGTALGNFAAARIEPLLANKDSKLGLNLTYLCSGLIIMLMFFLARDLRPVLNIFPGEGISLKTTLFSSMLILVPLGACIGAQFTFAFSFLNRLGTGYPAASGYLWESLGCFAGGIIFTYAAIPYLESSAAALLLSLFFIGAASIMCSGKFRKALLLGCLCLMFFLPWLSTHIENFTVGKLFRGFDVERVINSPFAQIVSASRNGERCIFYNGVPLLSLPDPDIEQSERFSHMPLLFVRAPKNVLILGGAAKYTKAVLDHGAESVDYAEQDPKLLETIKYYWPENFKDPRLTTHQSDGREFIKGTKTVYDAILIGAPYPVNLPLNRYYTKEFFELVKQKLSAGGILALSIPGSLVYVNSAMGKLNAIIKKTLDQSFPYTLIIPGDENIFIASKSELCGKGTLKSRFSRISDRTVFFSKNYIDYALSPQRQLWLTAEIGKYLPGAPVNRDFFPNALAASLVWWQSVFAPNATRIYVFITKYFLFFYFLPIAWLLTKKCGVSGTAFSSGFCAMGLQMASIWGLQVSNGNIYQLIGALNAFFMAGTALGAYSPNYKLHIANLQFRISKLKLLPKTNAIATSDILFFLWIVLWGGLFFLPLKSIIIFIIFSFGTGFILGLQFPMLASHNNAVNENLSAGRVYAFDLLGGWLAAIFAGMVLIPAGGFFGTIVFLAMIKAVSAFWWSRNSAQ